MNKNSTNNGQFYRSRKGWFLGVCKGLANYSGIPVSLIRFLVFLAFWASGLMPLVLIYIVSALIMKPEPIVSLEDDSEKDFYNSWTNDRTATLSGLKRKFNKLDKRTQRIETIITAKEYDWDRRFSQNS